MSAPMTSLPLTDRRPRPKRKRPLDRLSATLAAAKRQSRRDGIVLSLELANEGRSTLEILNPLDTFQLLVLDAKGFPVALPRGTPARIFINTRSLDIVRPYRIVTVENTRGDDGLLEAVDEEELSIPGRTVHTITIAVDRVAGATGKPRRIAAGTYRVKATLTLISRMGDTGHRVVASDYVKVTVVA